jgi:hypothetical protein
VVILLLIIAGLFIYAKEVKAPTPTPGDGGEQTVCTMEAKICPDGSAVGRSGPNCEFAACPDTGTTTDPNAPISVTAVLDQTVTAGAIKITPLTIIEDSRCPSDVVCIQAGTVRVLTRLAMGANTTEQTVKLGEGVSFGGYTISLTNALPVKISTHTVDASEYQLMFKVEKSS